MNQFSFQLQWSKQHWRAIPFYKILLVIKDKQVSWEVDSKQVKILFWEAGKVHAVNQTTAHLSAKGAFTDCERARQVSPGTENVNSITEATDTEGCALNWTRVGSESHRRNLCLWLTDELSECMQWAQASNSKGTGSKQTNKQNRRQTEIEWARQRPTWTVFAPDLPEWTHLNTSCNV